MVSFKSGLSALIAIGAVTLPVRACVDFSLNYVQGDGLDQTLVNAGLTDNGSQVCALQNQFVDYPPSGDIALSCWEGYSASLNVDTAILSYAYSTWSGTVKTNRKVSLGPQRRGGGGSLRERGSSSGPGGPGSILSWTNLVYYKVRTWGCS